jgi:hypothetical protein
MTMDEKKAQQILREVGKALIDGFIGLCPDAVALKSQEPAVCWEISGALHYAVVDVFSRPDEDNPDRPFLLQIRVNDFPPPAIHDFLKKRGPRAAPLVVAEHPVLNVFTRAKEAPLLGPWLVFWHKAYLEDDPCPPQPPMPLLTQDDKQEGQEEFTHRDFTELGEVWRCHQHLYSRRALRDFEPWYRDGMP